MSEARRPWVLPAAWSVLRGRDVYLTQNGFSVAEYDKNTSALKYAGIRLCIPNPAKRQWAIRRHDLHHVATGFGTDILGEAEISAWELGHGLRGLGLYVGAIVLWGALVGLLLAPRRTLRALRAARSGSSLFNLPELAYEQALRLSIGELRERLGLPADGLAHCVPRLHAGAPKSLQSL